jgi:uncharacterized membrane protein YdbT with pleckstrin-like domain
VVVVVVVVVVVLVVVVVWGSKGGLEREMWRVGGARVEREGKSNFR